VTGGGVVVAAGDMHCGLSGIALVNCSISAVGALFLTGIRLVLTRSPGTPQEAIFSDVTPRLVSTSDTFSVWVGGAVDINAGDFIRIEAQSIGANIDIVPGEMGLWAHVVIG
jgi:hypothetical protein